MPSIVRLPMLCPWTIPAAATTEPLDGNQPPVPTHWRSERRRLGIDRRIVQDRALVDAAVDRARLDPHDELDRRAGDRRRRGDVCRQR